MSDGVPTEKPRRTAIVRSPWFLSLLCSAATALATLYYVHVHSVAWHRLDPLSPGAGGSLEGDLTLVRMIAAVLALSFGIWAVRRGDHRRMAWLSLGCAFLALLVAMIVLM